MIGDFFFLASFIQPILTEKLHRDLSCYEFKLHSTILQFTVTTIARPFQLRGNPYTYTMNINQPFTIKWKNLSRCRTCSDCQPIVYSFIFVRKKKKIKPAVGVSSLSSIDIAHMEGIE